MRTMFLCVSSAAAGFTLEFVQERVVVNDYVRKEFQRDFALQFFIARQPDDSHSAAPENFDERVAAKQLLTAGKLTKRRIRDVVRALVSHAEA